MFKIKTTQFCSCCLYFSLCHEAACFHLPCSETRAGKPFQRWVAHGTGTPAVPAPGRAAQLWAAAVPWPDPSSCSEGSAVSSSGWAGMICRGRMSWQMPARSKRPGWLSNGWISATPVYSLLFGSSCFVSFVNFNLIPNTQLCVTCFPKEILHVLILCNQ